MENAKNSIAQTVIGLAVVIIGLSWAGDHLGREIETAGRSILQWGSLAIIGALFLALAVGLAIGVNRALIEWERRLTVRAERRTVEAAADQAAAAAAGLWRDANITTIVAKADEQVFIKDGALEPFRARHLIDPQAEAVLMAAWKLWNELQAKPAGNIRIDRIEQPQLAAGPAMLELLPAITRLENILIVGGKGTGKTTLMQWLAAIRAELGRVLIFDSHAHPAKWPAGHVIGKGRDYQTIWGGMLQLVDLLDRRYKDFAAGAKMTGQFGTITNMIDELTLLPGIIKDLGGDIQAYNKPLLTEGRKVDLCAVWGVHSDRVDALGLKGAADLKECFDAVVYLKNIAGDRYALVDFGEGIDKTKRYRLPGPFVVAGQLAPGPVADVIEAEPSMSFHVAPEPVNVGPSEEEQAIIFHYVDLRDNDRGNFSYNEVARRALGSAGGRQVSQIKETLEKFGIEAI